jgi:hypothetical protein
MIKSLDNRIGLSINEVRDRYYEIENEFEKVKYSYSGLLSRFRRYIKDSDKKKFRIL